MASNRWTNGRGARPKEKKLADWQKCRNWLKHKEVTPASAKYPGLNEISSEYELYQYLKDGTELCRVIGLITYQKQTLEGIIYRTNSISDLDEKNIKLFIKFVESELKIQNVFGSHQEQVFRKFENFYKVLDGLSKISRHVEKKINIPGFDCVNKRQSAAYDIEDDYEINHVYDQLYDDNERIDQLYVKYIKCKDATDLYEAINELSKVNKSYLNRVLKNLKNNFVDKNTNLLLERHFFPSLRIEELITLHQDIDVEFEHMKVSFVRVGTIFENFRDRFLIYCCVCAKMKTLQEFLADQIANNIDIRTNIADLEKAAVKRALIKDARFLRYPYCPFFTNLYFRDVYRIQELIEMIPQHIMRYPLLIQQIQIFAEKEK